MKLPMSMNMITNDKIFIYQLKNLMNHDLSLNCCSTSKPYLMFVEGLSTLVVQFIDRRINRNISAQLPIT